VRARQSLYKAAYSYAPMSGITPEVRLKNEIRGFQPDLEARNQTELAKANVNHS
jgi:hypothetical protein